MKLLATTAFVYLVFASSCAQPIDFDNWKAPDLGDYRLPNPLQAPIQTPAPMQLSPPFKRADAATYTPPSPSPSSTQPTAAGGLTNTLFNKITIPSLLTPLLQWPSFGGSQGQGLLPTQSLSTPGQQPQSSQTPSTPSSSTPSQQQQQATPSISQQQQTPPTQAPSDNEPACSQTDSSPAAVLRCVNAVRTNPRAFTDGYDCDWQAWIDGISTPPRPALKTAAQLVQSAKGHAEWMARTLTFSHTGEGGSSVAQRIAATGWDQFPQAENIAVRYKSAYDVTMAWMCSEEGHRTTLMHCQLDSVGTAVSYASNTNAYFVQDFGCSATNTCSCGGST